MDSIELNLKVKAVLDSFDWNHVETPNQTNNPLLYTGILDQIGCDYTSLLINVLSPDLQKDEVQLPVNQPSTQLTQPRHSSLNAKQHQNYLQYLDKFKNIANNANASMFLGEDRQAFLDYKALQRKVTQEQHEFGEYSYQVALSRMANYDFVIKDAQNFYKHYLQYEVKRLLKYMQYYVFYDLFLHSVIPYTHDPQPKFEEHCVTLGKQSLIITPDPETPIPEYKPEHSKPVHLHCITEDENSQKLAKEWNADFVISISALRTLADNFPPFNNEWEMRFNVKQIKGKDGVVRSVVFIDKALVSMSVNGRDMMTRYYKKAVKQFLLNYSVPLEKNESASMPFSPNQNSRRTELESTSNKENDEKMSQENDGESDERYDDEKTIPQLDGANDKEFGKKSTKIKSNSKKTTKKLSTPESVSRIAKLSVWKSSFTVIPKMGTRSANPASTAAITGWSAASKQVELSKAEVSVDSEEDRLVIDSETDEAEPESKSTEKSSLLDEEEDQHKISFKATDIPTTILESVMSSDSEQDSDASDSNEAAPPRRSMRNRKKFETVDINQSGQKEKKLKSERVAKATNKSGKKNLFKQDKTNVETPLPPARLTRTRSSNASLAKEQTKLTKKSKMVVASSDDVKEPQLRGRLRSASKEIDKPQKSRQLRQKRKSIISTSSLNVDNVSSANETVSKSLKLQHVSSKNTKEPLKFANIVGGSFQPSQPFTSISKQQILSMSQPEKISKQKVINLQDTDSSLSSESQDQILAEKESNDLIGQILNMQKSREKTPPQEVSENRKSVLIRNTIIPVIPPPMQNFDEIFQLHSTRLVEPAKQLFYSLWSIGSHRVLIRGCLHGKIKQKFSTSFGKSQMDVGNVTIRTKLEYQPDIGYEMLSKSEACAEWLDLQFRPQPSTVLRCRVNPYTNTILRFDRVRNEEATYKSFEAAGFNHLQANKSLFSIFQKLNDKSMYGVGSYLITHKLGAKEFVVRKSHKENNPKLVYYDLHREYANSGCQVLCTPQTIPWNPLDPTKQTAWQYHKRRVPMMFDLKMKHEGSSDSSKKGKKRKAKI